MSDSERKEKMTNKKPKEEQLKLINNYTMFVDYIYPALINCSSRHRVLRDLSIELILRQYTLLNGAVKSDQISRIRKDSIKRAKRKLKYSYGEAKERFLASWLGHIKHADCYNLRKSLELV